MTPKTKKTITITVFILLLVLAGFIYVKFYFVFGEGVKAGNLNYFVHKGYVFKTYEGRLIQTGFRTQNGTSIQSNEFQFSVTDKNIADSLMRCSGKEVELHYKEYLGHLPWRGVSEFVVDGILMVQEEK
jgi:flagellar basal body-associated protein FliL